MREAQFPDLDSGESNTCMTGMHLFSLMKGPEGLSATHRKNPELEYKDDKALALLCESHSSSQISVLKLNTWQ
jgi:hypothetical protein